MFSAVFFCACLGECVLLLLPHFFLEGVRVVVGGRGGGEEHYLLIQLSFPPSSLTMVLF